jgi:IPT/TIG domain
MRRSPSFSISRASILAVLISLGMLASCTGGGGHGGHGGGGQNNVININGDIYLQGTSSGPNITFTDGTNPSLVVALDNIGNLPSDQLITVTVGLPNGVTYVSFTSTTPGWTCNASGQTVTCTSSAPIAGLTGTSTFLINVSVANNASGNASLSISISTPDGNPPTHSGNKGVIFVSQAPSITSVTPNSGPVGTSVTIAGSNFGSSQGSSTVTFNGTSAGTAPSWSATSITVNVPTGATTGNVVVTVGGTASNGVSFTVTTSAGPNISTLDPMSGAVGTAVIISGSGFGSSQGTSTVTFNGTSAGTATNWSSTSISVKVPTGATTGPVVVTVGGVASNGAPFTVTEACASGGNAASLLTGDYAFREQEFLQTTGGGFAVAAGRFHADGVNTISNGLLEYNSVSSGNSSNGTPVTFTGCFSIDFVADSSGPALGTMTLVNAASGFNATISIAVQTDGNGRFINFDLTSPRGSGDFEKQCPNAANATCPTFSDSNISGDYGFGFDGLSTTTATSNAGAVGRLTASGSGGVTGGVVDISTSGGVAALDVSFSSASYTVTDATSGRVKVTFTLTYNGGPNNGVTETFNLACYIAKINTSGVSGVLDCMGLDAPSSTLPLLSGQFGVQNTPSGGWTNTNAAPASNASVISSTGINGSGLPRVDVGQVAYNTGASPPTVTINQDENNGGSVSFQTFTEDISVASNGRLEATISGKLVAVCYVLDAGKASCVNEANNAALVFLGPQEAEPSGGFTAANFDNSFAIGSVDPAVEGVTDIDGVLTSTGSTGTLSGSEYVNSASGVSTPPVAATYTIASSSDAAIGRVTITVTSPSGESMILYIIDSNHAVAMSTTDTEPATIYFNH